MDASIRSSGFNTHSSQRFSFDPDLEFPLELTRLPAPEFGPPPVLTEAEAEVTGWPRGPVKNKNIYEFYKHF